VPENRLLRSAITRIPASEWLRSYEAGSFKNDLVAGLSLAAFVIPESLAYASLAQLPPVTGLYCYLAAGIAYALFGTQPTARRRPHLRSGNCCGYRADDPERSDHSRSVALASALALMVGLISIGGRYIGFANAAYFISDPVLLGFKTGAALYIASTQLPKLFGVEGATGNFFERIGHVIGSLPEAHLPSLLFGLGAIALFIVFQRSFPGRPTTLVVVVAGGGTDECVSPSRDGHKGGRRAPPRPA